MVRSYNFSRPYVHGTISLILHCLGWLHSALHNIWDKQSWFHCVFHNLYRFQVVKVHVLSFYQRVFSYIWVSTCRQCNKSMKMSEPVPVAAVHAQAITSPPPWSQTILLLPILILMFHRWCAMLWTLSIPFHFHTLHIQVVLVVVSAVKAYVYVFTPLILLMCKV